MKAKYISIAAILLWVITIGVFGYYFVVGQSKTNVDGRVTVRLSPTERHFVLAEMRTLLQELQGVVSRLAADDLKGTAKHLSNMGVKMAADDSVTLLGKLPLALKTMGMGLHRKMDVLAAKIKDGTMNKKQLLGELSTALSTCVSCHATYRIALEPVSPLAKKLMKKAKQK